jgi:hypothetical protein
MLMSVLPYKDAFTNLAMQDANYTTCPASEEWDEIFTMQEFLEVFHKGKMSFN